MTLITNTTIATSVATTMEINTLKNSDDINLINNINKLDKSQLTDEVIMYLFKRHLETHNQELGKFLMEFMEYKLDSAQNIGNVDDILNIINTSISIDTGINTYNGSLNAELRAELNNSQIDFDKIIDLIKKGADVDIKNKEGCTALHKAIQYGNIKIVRGLITLGANVNDNIKPVLHTAMYYDRIDIIHELIESDADVDIIDNDGNTPLHIAVDIGKLKIIKILVEAGANINIKDAGGMTAIDYAKCHNRPQIIKYLEKNNEDNLNAELRGELCGEPDTIFEPDFNNIMKLIKAGADINTKCVRYGCTALHVAVVYGRNDIVRELITLGADINTRNKNGLTPLYIDRITTVDILIKAGANVNITDYLGNTPIFYCSDRDYWIVIAIMLIKAGADLNIKNKAGLTPLLHAMRRRFCIISLLVLNGADINAKNADGNTALDLAKMNEDDEVVEFLEQYIK